jgi:hypothetical protein
MAAVGIAQRQPLKTAPSFSICVSASNAQTFDAFAQLNSAASAVFRTASRCYAAQQPTGAAASVASPTESHLSDKLQLICIERSLQLHSL